MFSPETLSDVPQALCFIAVADADADTCWLFLSAPCLSSPQQGFLIRTTPYRVCHPHTGVNRLTG